MIRTQISLDKEEYERVKREAKAQGVSVAEFVRRAIQKSLPAEAKKPWMRYAGLVESGDANSTLSIDEIVYGLKD